MDKKQESTVEAGMSVNTPLTPNSNAVTTPSGSTNNDTRVTFLYNNATSYWTPSVSLQSSTAVIGQDAGNGIVTFMQGLTVEYQPLAGGYYTVIVTGKIKDSGEVYDLKNKSLGTFA